MGGYFPCSEDIDELASFTFAHGFIEYSKVMQASKTIQERIGGIGTYRCGRVTLDVSQYE